MSAAFDQMQPLSGEGEARAKALLNVTELRKADFAVASTTARAISTIRYIIEADGLAYETDVRLRELEFGGFPNQPSPPVKPGHGLRKRQWHDIDLAPEGGESIRQCRTRMTEAINDIAAAHSGERILVASHGAAICAYLSGIIPGIDHEFVMQVGQPEVFVLRFDGGASPSVSRLGLPFDTGIER